MPFTDRLFLYLDLTKLVYNTVILVIAAISKTPHTRQNADQDQPEPGS
ncbi:hypothetical protein DSUL_60042 [Desulfovibrionales bacterium]